MGDFIENILNTTLTDTDINAITTALNTIASKLPAISLDDKQRQKLRSMDMSNKIFVRDAITETTINGASIIPAYITLASVQNDLTLFEQLDAIELQFNNLSQRISDCKKTVGDKAYGAAILIYKAFENANNAGISNARQSYKKLKAQYDSQANGILL